MARRNLWTGHGHQSKQNSLLSIISNTHPPVFLQSFLHQRHDGGGGGRAALLSIPSLSSKYEAPPSRMPSLLVPPIPMAQAPSFRPRPRRRLALARAAAGPVVGRRPLEEVYKVRVERGAAAQARVEALRVMETWPAWRTGGRCRMPWDWQVDQLVYIVSGEVRVLPAGATSGEDYMHFVAGDLVRYPKWLEADLHFDGPYEERYRFLAYGDD